MEKCLCPHCGAKMTEYKHTINKSLLIGLLKMYNINKPINLKSLKLTRNQWDNFQKLRYWGLVTKHYDIYGKRVGGSWDITKKGFDFVRGKLSVPKSVWTYRGETVRFEKELVSFKDFIQV